MVTFNGEPLKLRGDNKHGLPRFLVSYGMAIRSTLLFGWTHSYQRLSTYLVSDEGVCTPVMR